MPYGRKLRFRRDGTRRRIAVRLPYCRMFRVPIVKHEDSREHCVLVINTKHMLHFGSLDRGRPCLALTKRLDVILECTPCLIYGVLKIPQKRYGQTPKNLIWSAFGVHTPQTPWDAVQNIYLLLYKIPRPVGTIRDRRLRYMRRVWKSEQRYNRNQHKRRHVSVHTASRAKCYPL